jgi:hypothetical protein
MAGIPRHRLLAALAALVAALTLAGVPPAQAGLSAGRSTARSDLLPSGSAAHPLSYLSAPMQRTMGTVISRVAAVRAAERSASLSRLLAALDVAARRSAPAVPVPPSPTARQRQQVAPLPPGLRRPVAGLLAAVQAAKARLGMLPGRQVVGELRALLTGQRDFARRAASAPVGDRWVNPVTKRVSVLHQPVSPTGPVPISPATRRAVAAGPAVTVMLAAAIDRYLPALRTVAREVPHATGAADPCNLLDEAPVLCVGSGNHTTFTSSYLLLVDLGGDSTFDDFAGAAPFLPSSSATSYEPVSVTLALGAGNDTYQAGQLPIVGGQTALDVGGTYSAVTLGDGAGLLGGVGILVDDSGGHSTFTAAAPPLTDPSSQPFDIATIAQGAGAYGTGLLVKDGGSGSFTAAGPHASGRDYSGVYAQGDGQWDPEDGGCSLDGGLCSMGALIDLGTGNDSYTINAGTFDQPLSKPVDAYAGAGGQGAGWGDGGAGFLVDQGGSDSFSVGGQAATADHTFGITPFTGPTLTLTGQGYGDVGAGLLVEGSGAHRYWMQAEMQSLGVQTSEIAGQAEADLLGLGVLDDAGSSASYTLGERLTDQHTFVVDGSCGCSAGVSVNGTNVGFQPTSVYGQGGTWGGTALLDNAGRGQYLAVDDEDIHDTLSNELPAGSPTPSLSVVGYQEGHLAAQGAEFPNLDSTSYALLLNRGSGGRSTFTSDNLDTVEAKGTGPKGAVPTVSATSPWQFDYSATQGATNWNANCPCSDQGALIDLGGPGDSFHTVESHAVTTSPDSGADYASGAFWDPSHGQGSGAVFVALGAAPQIVSTPANGVCPDSPDPIGFGDWVTCSFYSDPALDDPNHTTYDYTAGDYNPGHGVGIAPRASGQATTLTVVKAPGRAVDGGVIPVELRLTGPAGKPIRGALVHLDAQVGLPVPSPLYQWINVDQVDGQTDARGYATLRLPIAYQRILGVLPSSEGWATQLLATYDGGPQLYPDHAAVPVTVTAPASG